MTASCATPIADETLLDYWSGDLDGPQTDRVEQHVFACAVCTAQLESVAALAQSIKALACQGRVSGIISRAVLNRLQRDGVRVRAYALSPGETVPCSIFPGDDLVVTSLRADFAGVDTVRLSVTGPDHSTFGDMQDVPVLPADGEVLWATAGAFVRQMPSIRLQLTLTSSGGTVLGEYVLEHSAPDTHS